MHEAVNKHVILGDSSCTNPLQIQVSAVDTPVAMTWDDQYLEILPLPKTNSVWAIRPSARSVCFFDFLTIE